MPKARSDAWWTKLDDAAQQQAFELLTHLGLQAGRLALAAKLSIKPPSLSATSRFYCYARAEESRWRIQKALQDKTSVQQMIAATGDVSQAVAAGIGQLALDATLSRDSERLVSLVKSLRDLSRTREDELARKLAAAQARCTALEGQLQAATGAKAPVDPAKVADELDRHLGRKQ